MPSRESEVVGKARGVGAFGTKRASPEKHVWWKNSMRCCGFGCGFWGSALLRVVGTPPKSRIVVQRTPF